ncbi:hypothetical protein EJ05DRAFT_504679 [Pseudovirgaria hyperparasitica]|uniref:Uncharacterized protein n=1 Tax=Pseudovirgaria hyperparasitica TaxID=470096 RepID=A0A6A6VSL5_9PEZI|nr:uncharacterized protein EJ05DRAFT_504679 [Pseudovirgaria hyperparasitica]KAF2753582.1 hypothetical protein EJ05DRAFT_504679 [Pseudovirgaria hyperparasitica]
MLPDCARLAANVCLSQALASIRENLSTLLESYLATASMLIPPIQTLSPVPPARNDTTQAHKQHQQSSLASPHLISSHLIPPGPLGPNRIISPVNPPLSHISNRYRANPSESYYPKSSLPPPSALQRSARGLRKANTIIFTTDRPTN